MAGFIHGEESNKFENGLGKLFSLLNVILHISHCKSVRHTLRFFSAECIFETILTTYSFTSLLHNRGVFGVRKAKHGNAGNVNLTLNLYFGDKFSFV